MLAGLLQPGTRAGVWTFARWVDDLVPVAEVDEAWKRRTQSLSKQIGSPGQFTNIEGVLDRASRDWTGRPPNRARHLVLLTDGMVDVSKSPDENAASRARITDQILPRLKADAVRVHTIALSARADHELMRQLSGETGGWYQQVDRAADLQRVFLRMFEKVGRPETVPLRDNRFVVDGAIEEATVLAFREPGSAPIRLQSPSGDVFSDSDLPSGVAWYRDEGYDLITVASPEKGEWVLLAELDPDNRVMIVTDLKLQTNEIPTHLAVGEQTLVEANLSSRGKVVTRRAFLNLLEVNGDLNGIADIGKLPINDLGEGGDESAGDGRYATQFAAGEPIDEAELVVAVDSPTFMREKRFRFVVHELVDAAVEETPEGPVLRIRLEEAVMRPDATISAWQESVPGERTELELVAEGQGQWRAPLSDEVSPSYVAVSGSTVRGSTAERVVGPIMPEGVPLPPVALPAEPAEGPAETDAPASVPEAAQPQAMPEAAEEGGGWLIPAVAFAGFNLLLLAGGLVWFLIRRRAGTEEEIGLQDLIDEVDAGWDAQGRPQEDAA
jgi:uncharacterized protein (TIGR03503 family)